MELNIFCGHFAGYIGAHYLNLPTTTQLEHRQSIFIDSYGSFSTVPKETTQLIDDLDADEYQKEEEEENYSDDDIDMEDDSDSDDDDFSYGISNRRRKMREQSGNTSNRDISNDFMAIYQSMLSQEQDKKSKLSKKDKVRYTKDNSSSLSTWSGKVTPIIQPQQSKRKYDNTSPASKLQELQRKRKRKQLREYVARATGIDASSEDFRTLFSELCDDTDDVMDDAMGDVTTDRAWDLEGWGDLLAAPLHPRSLCPVPGAQDISQRWGAVENTLLRSVEEEGGECVRFFAEECDRVGGFKFVVDAQSGWGRVGETVLEYIREDFPKVSILCVPAHNFSFDTNFSSVGGASGAAPSQQKRLQAAGASVCAALSAKFLSPLASLTLPLMSPFARFAEKISAQAKKQLILRSEERLSYDASPIALTLNALAAAHTPLPETLAFLSPVGTSVNAAAAELCVAPSPADLRGIMTSVPMTPFAENRLRKSDVISERAYSLVQGTRGLGAAAQSLLLAPSRAWNPREGTALVGGTRDVLSPLMYFPSRMYGDVFGGCGMTSYGHFQSVASAGIFHSSGEVFKYFDGLGRMVNEVVPRECLQMLLDDSTGSRMEVVDELSQIADDYIRF